MYAEFPSSDHLIHNLLNKYYKVIGTTFVANLGPMLSTCRLYEFTSKSFESLGMQLGFKLAKFSYHPDSGRFVPRQLYRILFRWMMATNTGMQLTVLLRKPKD